MGGASSISQPTGPFISTTPYATTVHSSQGTTAERVLIDTATHSQTTTKDVYYVAISRARLEARIYTDDVEKLPQAVAREAYKHAALDLARVRLSSSLPGERHAGGRILVSAR